MLDPSQLPKLILPDDFDDRAVDEIRMKGWFNAKVEIADGRHYEVNFYDSIRLQQEIAWDFTKLNMPCFAEPGIVVIPEITVEAIQRALNYLAEHHYFSYFSPL